MASLDPGKITLTGTQVWLLGRWVVGAGLMAVGGYIAYDDLGDGIRANAQSITHQAVATAGSIETLEDEIAALEASDRLTAAELEALRRLVLSESGDLALEISEVKGDIKVILRLLQDTTRGR